MLEAAGQLWHSARALLSNTAELVGLELRHAGISLALIVGLGVMVGLLAASLWFLLLAALIIWLVEGLLINWPASLLIAALINVVLGIGLAFGIKYFSKGLLFEASRRQLFGESRQPEKPVPANPTFSTTESRP